jgi:small-conductance mechanosensitive channel
MEDLERAFATVTEAARSFGAELISAWLLVQLGLILLAAGIGFGAQLLVRRRGELVTRMMGWPPVIRLTVHTLADNLGVIVFAILTATMRAALVELTLPRHSYLLDVSAKIATAWVVIIVLTGLIRNNFAHRIVAIVAWAVAALSIVGLLDATSQLLDSAAIVFGGLRISLLLVVKTALFLLVTLWLAVAASNLLDRWLRSTGDLTPSIQVLIGKLVRFGLVTLAIIVVLSTVGIDLSALALFSGAVGVGLGFGLQKIVSNLVSGVILLADKSIKPGDVISVGENFGWVDSLGARYTSVVIRDGREVLIPNEDLVTQRVINWSHSNDQVRLDVPFGVSYASDPHKVREIAVAAAGAHPRILKTPAALCHLTKFNDFSLDFVLRFWIRDPIDGITNIRGEVMLALWDAFKREGIEIPFPVRDVRITADSREPPENGTRE